MARLPEFSSTFQSRAMDATGWLASMIEPSSGDAPNIGANDGARLLPLTDTDYRDFRPSVQLATLLFAGCRAFGGEGPWNTPNRTQKYSRRDAELAESFRW